jgi:hypothetical protein
VGIALITRILSDQLGALDGFHREIGDGHRKAEVMRRLAQRPFSEDRLHVSWTARAVSQLA